VKTKFLLGAVVAAGIALSGAMEAQGQVKLIATGTLTESSAGLFQDLSGLDYNLENGAPANLLGGLGSGLTWEYGDRFLALPDRGPNAQSFDSLVDDTDIVKELTANGINADQIPAKLEGITLGPDVDNNGTTLHTLWVANDNDFLQDLNGPGTNPNQFFVFGFSDAELKGSALVLEQPQGSAKKD
jgi:hypothetical protein